MTVLLRAQDIHKTFRQPGGGALTVLDNISLAIHPGEVVCMLGASGSGKTTFLRILSGEETPDKGTIQSDVPRPGAQFGYLSQGDRLLPWRDIVGNVALGLELVGYRDWRRGECDGVPSPSWGGLGRGVSSLKSGSEPETPCQASLPPPPSPPHKGEGSCTALAAKSSPSIREIALEALRDVGMESFAERMPSQLSGGQQQRILLARMLALKPRLLLLDEPTSSLDVLARRELAALIKNYTRTQQAATLVVTHSVEEACFIADRICLITRSPAKLFKEIRISDAGREEALNGVMHDLWSALEEAA